MDESLATITDVEHLLGYQLEGAEVARVQHLLIEATELVYAYARVLPRDLDEVPLAVRTTVARMAARTHMQSENGAIGTTSAQVSAGPFSRSYSFADGANDGGVWLNKSDKLKLRRWRGGAFTIKTW